MPPGSRVRHNAGAGCDFPKNSHFSCPRAVRFSQKRLTNCSEIRCSQAQTGQRPVALRPAETTTLAITSALRHAPGLGVAMVADQGASGSDPGDSAIRQRLLLEDFPPATTAINEPTRLSPTILGSQNEPDLPGDLWGEDLARNPLDW